MKSIVLSLIIGFLIGCFVADLDKSKACDKKIAKVTCNQDLSVQFNTPSASHKIVCADSNIGEGCVLKSEEKNKQK